MNWAEDHALTVVIAARGYPGDYARGEAIGLPSHRGPAGAALPRRHPAREGGAWSPPAGASSTSPPAARRSPRPAPAPTPLADAVDWPGGFFRRDIGWRALDRRRQAQVKRSFSRSAPGDPVAGPAGDAAAEGAVERRADPVRREAPDRQRRDARGRAARPGRRRTAGCRSRAPDSPDGRRAPGSRRRDRSGSARSARSRPAPSPRAMTSTRPPVTCSRRHQRGPAARDHPAQPRLGDHPGVGVAPAGGMDRGERLGVRRFGPAGRDDAIALRDRFHDRRILPRPRPIKRPPYARATPRGWTARPERPSPAAPSPRRGCADDRRLTSSRGPTPSCARRDRRSTACCC